MSVKKWIIVALVVVLLLEFSSFSAFKEFSGSGSVPSGESYTITIARGYYASGRVEIQIWNPGVNSTSPTLVTFPNGTTDRLAAFSELTLSVSIGGPGFTHGCGYGFVSPQSPVVVSIVPLSILKEIEMCAGALASYDIEVSGQASIWYQVWEVAP
jgi:hypothetical protein